jgi:hypothetical protein
MHNQCASLGLPLYGRKRKSYSGGDGGSEIRVNRSIHSERGWPAGALRSTAVSRSVPRFRTDSQRLVLEEERQKGAGAAGASHARMTSLTYDVRTAFFRSESES